MKWIPFEQWDRGLLYPSDLGEDLPHFISKKTQKNFRRNLRGLTELGNLEWELILGGRINNSNFDDFVRLENMGWKGSRKSSLYSRANHRSFFQEMTENFNQDGRAFFSELRLNGQTIASTSNYISGNVGFAFKIGWDPAYAKYSPGIQNELMLLTCDDKTFKQLDYIDSGSSQNSYINTLWPGKRSIQTGVYLNSNIGKLISPAMRLGWYPGLGLAKKLKQTIYNIS
jgi:CelD/BcsL family acetyltransferase involved in cellulose biosynthesis